MSKLSITNQNICLKKSQSINNQTLKQLHGQFFTIANPFNHEIFYEWIKKIPEEKKCILLEPFAGRNNIVHLINETGFQYDWECYDININFENIVPKYKIIQRDTINNFPDNHYVAITNPPYLAKNSATRKGLIFPATNYDDLYKLCLDIMLSRLDYVGAIIPASFINSNLFLNRIFAYISLPYKMFNDTDCPVCLALFIPENLKSEFNLSKEDFFIYCHQNFIGQYSQLNKLLPKALSNIDWKFNDPSGSVGIICIDNTTLASIKFIDGNEISKSRIKVSSRSSTRVSGLPEWIKNNDFIYECNKKFAKYRADTADIFLTPFKGLRKDSQYRRRLDFATARNIMNSVIDDLKNGISE